MGKESAMAYDDNNIFAKILRGEAPAFQVYEDTHNIAILDVMPQSDGHTLVLPKASAENLFDLENEAADAMIRAVKVVARGVRDAFEPDGLRLMQFNGGAAGQTVFHFHMHIVPCYEDRPMRGHGRGMADATILEDHAEKLRAALAQL